MSLGGTSLLADQGLMNDLKKITIKKLQNRSKYDTLDPEKERILREQKKLEK